MKKLWIMLMACMCVGVAQAQDSYKQLVTYGDFLLGNECIKAQCSVQDYTMEKGFPAPVEGVGKDGTKGIAITSPSTSSHLWDTQMWIVLNEEMTEGDQFLIEFDYKATVPTKVLTEFQYDEYSIFDSKGLGEVEFKTEWQHFRSTLRVKYMDSSWMKTMRSICFQLGTDRLNEPRTEDVTFYIDNVSVLKEVWDNPYVSGACGDGLKWELNKANATLTIDGEGAMTNYEKLNGVNLTSTAPWYEYRDQIKRINVNEGVTKIGSYAFTGMSGVEVITLPTNSLNTIRMFAFWGCTSLTKISLPLSLTVWEAGAFRLCGLKEVGIPKSLSTIPSQAFHQCNELEYVNLNKVSKIGSFAFSNCPKLQSAILPSTLVSLGDNAFEGTPALESVDLREALKEIGQDVFKNSGVKTVTFFGCPDKINSGMFNGCKNLTEVTLPEGLQTIPDKMFMNCTSLSDITLPASVTSIGEQAFAGCQLTDVTCKSTTPASCAENAFTIDATTSKILSTLHLPQDADDAYRNTTPWSLFQNYDEPASTNPAKQDYSIYLPHMTIAPGEILVMPVMVKNLGDVDDFMGFLHLPEGFTLTENGEMPFYRTKEDRFETDTWIPCTSFWSNGAPAVYFNKSINECTLKKGDSVAMILCLKADTNLTPGTYDGTVDFFFNDNAYTGNTKFTFSVKDPFECTRLKGDVNEDGKVSINDVNILIEILKKLK